jgi:hypothetical protein
MQWDYSAVVKAEVCGNTHGLSIMRAALFNCFEDLYDSDEENAQIILKRPAENGEGEDELEVTLDTEEDLEDICVSVSIVKHEKE